MPYLKLISCLLIVALSTSILFGQTNQPFSLIFSNYYTNDLNTDEFYTGSTLGSYGIAGEIRYRFINEKEPITTEIGIVYHQLNFKQHGDIPVSAYEKNRFHLVSLPLYFIGKIDRNLEINFYLSLEIPFLASSKNYDGSTFLSKTVDKINPFLNIGAGTGLAIRHYFPLNKNNRFFLELFFKRHALFAGLNSNENFYLDRIKKPFSIGLNIGVPL